ncbi:UNVERIFIED_CONTAM: hypothetical protein FKN15_007678 [Acipenser sinensis]
MRWSTMRTENKYSNKPVKEESFLRAVAKVNWEKRTWLLPASVQTLLQNPLNSKGNLFLFVWGEDHVRRKM